MLVFLGVCFFLIVNHGNLSKKIQRFNFAFPFSSGLGLAESVMQGVVVGFSQGWEEGVKDISKNGMI